VRTLRNSSLEDRRASVLLLVLVLIAVVSFALTMFIERAEVEIKGEGYFVKRSELRKDAWSMMEVAVAALADVKAIEGSLHAPAQGWGDPLAYAQIETREGLQVNFEFVDESGKVDLNSMELDSLILLFDELGFELDIASQLANVLLDWIDEDDDTRIDGAESREYSTLDLDANPANQPLKSLDELRYLFGFGELFFDEDGLELPVFKELAEAVTTYPVQRLNVNSASSLALRAIADLDDVDKEAIDSFRKGIDGILGTEDDAYFANAEDLAAVLLDVPEGSPLDQRISVMTVRVTVSDSGYSYTLVGTFDVNAQPPTTSDGDGNLSYPFLFIELREEPGADDARPA